MPEFVTYGIRAYSNRIQHHYQIILQITCKLCIMAGNHVSKLIQNFMHIHRLAEKQ